MESISTSDFVGVRRAGAAVAVGLVAAWAGVLGCVHAPAAQTIRGEAVPRGTVLLARLDRAVGLSVPHVAGDNRDPGSRSRAGERFEARVESRLVDADGRVVVPRGATLLGHVVAVRPPRPGEPAEIVLDVDALRVGGIDHAIDARVKAVDPEAAKRGLDERRLRLGVRAEKRGAVLGADRADGGEGGTAISLGTDPARATLPANTGLAIELREGLRVASLRPGRATASTRPARAPLVDDLRIPQAPMPERPGVPGPAPIDPGGPSISPRR